MTANTRVLIVDRHGAFRHDLAVFLPLLGTGLEVVGEVGSIRAAYHVIKALTPEVILLDLDLPGEDALEAARFIRHFSPQIAIVVISNDDALEYERAAFAAGARAYVNKLDLVQALPRALASIGVAGTAEMPDAMRPVGDRELRDGDAG